MIEIPSSSDPGLYVTIKDVLVRDRSSEGMALRQRRLNMTCHKARLSRHLSEDVLSSFSDKNPSTLCQDFKSRILKISSQV